MRTPPVVAFLLLATLLPSTLTAEVVLRPRLDSSGGEPAARVHPAPQEKVDSLAEQLFVPRYLVDTSSPGGTTTLFAVRNTSPAPLDISVAYRRTNGLSAHHELLTLGPHETFTRNVRDVASELPVDPDGFARGLVVVNAGGDGFHLTGDYLQVDVDDDFATGDRMVSPFDRCDGMEVRILDFGTGTNLTFLISSAKGANEATDEPSFSYFLVRENGMKSTPVDVFTDEVGFVLNSVTDLGFAGFGTIVLDFSNAGSGYVFGEYSAGGKFSVGINGACLD